MNKLYAKTMVVLTILIILLSAAVSSADLTETNKEKDIANTGNQDPKWTVMVYFAGDHHRGYEYEYTQGLITSVGSNKDVNIVGLFDAQEEGDTTFSYFEKDLVVPLSWYETESNMADPDNFQKFLELSMYKYPAEHYALFTLSAWGSGWQGVFSDTSGTSSSKTLDLITMQDIGEVLSEVTDNGTNKIDLYAIDVCVPGMIEVASEIGPYVEYMVANEEHGFGGSDGLSDEGTPLEWNYTAFLSYIVNNPFCSPEDFAKKIVDTYQPGTYTSKIFNKITAPSFYPIVVYHTDLSATNLSKLLNLNTAVEKLAEILKNNLSDLKDEIKKARLLTREYGKLYRRFYFLPSFIISIAIAFEPFGYDCFIDLYNFTENLYGVTSNKELKNVCQHVMDEMNNTIIASKDCVNDSSHGLSIYFPEFKCQYDQSIWRGMGNPDFKKIPSYETLKFSKDTNWDEFIKTYLKI